MPHSLPDNNVKEILNLLESNTPFAFTRFNDGEVGGIDNANHIAARGDQPVNLSLHKKLIECISHRQKNYLVGVPCSICFPHYAKVANDLVGDYEHKTLAIALTNRNWKYWLDNCESALQGKSIFWIGGNDQDVNKIPYFSTDKVALYPRRNTWAVYQKIYDECFEASKDFDITFISLGPTARILACEWFKDNSKSTYIDIGSTFDPFTRNVSHNCHLGWAETGFNRVKPCAECN